MGADSVTGMWAASFRVMGTPLLRGGKAPKATGWRASVGPWSCNSPPSPFAGLDIPRGRRVTFWCPQLLAA